MDYIEECKAKGFDNMQIHEVEEGFRHGLNGDQVDLYADIDFDHLQMQEIRLGLQDGLNAEQIHFFARKEFDWKQMNHIRQNLKNDNLVDEHKAADLHGKRIKNTGLLAVVGTLLIAGTAGGYFAYHYYSLTSEDLFIQLSADKIDIEYGSDFDAQSYIVDRSKDSDDNLSLPDNIDTKKLGTYTAAYTLSNPYKTVSSIMTVNVVDRDPPSLVLTDTTAIKYRTDDFACRTFISAAYDNVDGNIKDKVICGDIDKTLDQQTVKYTVSDSSGNATEATLQLNLQDVPQPTPEIIYVPSGGGTGTAGESNSGKSGVSGGNHGTQNFMFSDGYDMDSGYSACVLVMNNVGHGSCTPLKNSAGNYSGYQYTD